MSGHRVVITGMGVKSPAGNTVADAVATVLKGRSTAATVEDLVTAAAPVPFACTVPDFPITDYLTPRERAKVTRTVALGIAAAADAAADASLDAAAADPDRVSVYVGTVTSGLGTTIQLTQKYTENMTGMPVNTVSKIMSNAVAAGIGLRIAARGPYLTFATACASSTTAIGEAMLRIRAGAADVVIAGGADTPVEPLMMTSFWRIGALSKRVDRPWEASRPFDAGRDGFVMGEGAAFVVLERRDHAVARGARIHGEVTGYGTNSDAFHIVAPRPEGDGAAACMRLALTDAGLDAGDVGHINAHGTSTTLNDQAESAAIVRCFGSQPPPLTANKGVVGHLLGAAGAFEAVLALSAANDGLIPPVANFTGGPDADRVDVVAGEPRKIGPAPVISNSFGFGGHNACLVLTPAVLT